MLTGSISESRPPCPGIRTPQQKEALEVIIEELNSLQDPDWPARAILLWSDGIPQSDAAMKLDIAEEAIELVRRRWLLAAARIGAAEARVCNGT
jgi:hypothetical protein